MYILKLASRPEASVSKQVICRITSRSRDADELDPQSPSPWRCSHPVNRCGTALAAVEWQRRCLLRAPSALAPTALLCEVSRAFRCLYYAFRLCFLTLQLSYNSHIVHCTLSYTLYRGFLFFHQGKQINRILSLVWKIKAQ